VPEAGLEFSAVEDEKSARMLAEQRFMEARAESTEAMASAVPALVRSTTLLVSADNAGAQIS